MRSRLHTTARHVGQVNIDLAGKLLTRPFPCACTPAPVAAVVRDQARYVRQGRPLNWLEAYPASQVVASDPAGSADAVPALSPVLPASMEAWRRR